LSKSQNVVAPTEPRLDPEKRESVEKLSQAETETRENVQASEVSPRPGDERSVRMYEQKCPLLAQNALERLRQRGIQRDSELSETIGLAEAHGRQQLEKLELVSSKRKRKALKLDVRQEMMALREKIIGVAAQAARAGVQEFADGLLLSQNRLGVHANWLREYAARLAAAIRSTLGAAQVFQTETLSPWRQDPITQKAIQTCEEILLKRWQMGDGRPYGGGQLNASNRGWPVVVQEWDAFKAAEKIYPGPRERIPESVIRTILSSQYRTNADEVKLPIWFPRREQTWLCTTVLS
jgi:hypothetical protein